MDHPGEYPRINERWTGRKNRFVFLATDGGPGTGDLCHRGIGRFDHETGDFIRWRAPDGQSVSEPVFVARAANAPEGSGWLLTVAFDERRTASHLAVLNVEDLAAGPIATCLLDHRVPSGFHGSFAPAGQATRNRGRFSEMTPLQERRRLRRVNHRDLAGRHRAEVGWPGRWWWKAGVGLSLRARSSRSRQPWHSPRHVALPAADTMSLSPSLL